MKSVSHTLNIFLLLLILLVLIFGCANGDEGINAIRDVVPPTVVSCSFDNETDLSEESQCDTVFITKTGTKYHRDGCRYLKESKIPIDIADLNTEKYKPCSVCRPVINDGNDK